MHLYKPTVWFRTTLQTQGRVILAPEADVPSVRSYRTVKLFVQSSPPIELMVDCPPASGASRDAYWPLVPEGKIFDVHLLPDQYLVGRAQDRQHELSVLVEYWACEVS